MIDYKRIAFWAQQPTFDRDGEGLFNVEERADRLKRMHDEFGTTPEPVQIEKFACESRMILNEMYYGSVKVFRNGENVDFDFDSDGKITFNN